MNSMNNNEQIYINLREPVATWRKVVYSVVALLLFTFLLSCCSDGIKSERELSTLLLLIVMLGLPMLIFTFVALNSWWGKKYLALGPGGVEMHWVLFCFHRVRRVVLGRNSKLMLNRVTHMVQDNDGSTCYDQMELHLTDAYGQKIRLLAFDVSERERAEAIFQIINQRLPELKPEYEGKPLN